MDNIKNFKIILDKSLATPASFTELILSELESNREEKFQELLKVFDDGNVIFSNLVSKFIVDNANDTDVSLLIKMIDKDIPKQAIEIINILEKLKCKDAITRISSILSEETRELIIPSVQALSTFAHDDKTALDALINYFLKCKDDIKFSATIRLLLPLSSLIIPIFLSKYRSLNDDRKVWVLKYLAETGHSETLRLFSDELAASPLDKGVFCIYGLGKIRSDEAVKVLSKQCDNNEWFIRKKVAEALGQSESSNAIKPLLCLLKDTSLMVQAAAVEALTKVGNMQPEALIRQLNTAGKKEKVNLLRAMGQLKNEKFVAPLVAALNDADALFFCIDSIGDLGFKSAAEPLKKLLTNKIWFNRLNALEALWKLGVEDIATIAQDATEDDNDMVRNTATRILSSLSVKS